MPRTTTSSSSSTAAGVPRSTRNDSSMRPSRSTARKRKRPDGRPPPTGLLTCRGTRSTSGPSMPRLGYPSMAPRTAYARSTATSPGTTNCAPRRSITAARPCTPTPRTTRGCSSDPARSADGSPFGLRELGVRKPARIDWWGNATFALGLIGVMIGITYGIQPYGGHTMGWTSPLVLGTLLGGVALLVVFCFVELRVAEPMFHLELFRIRAFAAGNLAAALASMGRGGLQFVLIIWLQGIWLPEHGYAFSRTPLWAGIYMLPLTIGILYAGPASGWLSESVRCAPVCNRRDGA